MFSYNSVEYDICQTQGWIYKLAAKMGYDMKLFSDMYLKSDFCRRAFDTKYSRFQLSDAEESMDFILPEIGNCIKKMEQDEIFSPDVAEWIGFVYRQLYIETQIPSKVLQETVSFTSMCRYYPGLHTIDEENATEIICEDFGLKKV